LAGWKASLLNTMGRAVLADSVLGNLLIYAMGAMELPKGVIGALDTKRRSFMWSAATRPVDPNALLCGKLSALQRRMAGLASRI